jgi:hypothetical protein
LKIAWNWRLGLEDWRKEKQPILRSKIKHQESFEQIGCK